MVDLPRDRARWRRVAVCRNCGHQVTTLTLAAWDLVEGDDFVTEWMRRHSFSCPANYQEEPFRRRWRWRT